jgi:hypothetical protein
MLPGSSNCSDFSSEFSPFVHRKVHRSMVLAAQAVLLISSGQSRVYTRVNPRGKEQ